MNDRSDRHLRVTDEDQWHSVLGQCDDDSLSSFSPEGFATQVRQRDRRCARRRRLLVGGGISAILLLAVVARPTWDRTAVSPQAVDPPGFARLDSTSERNATPADNISAEATVEELDSVMAQLRSDLEVLHDAERSADERRRIENAALRMADQIRQQAEISVYSSSTQTDPSTS